jgi:hypothetical protein
MTPAEKATWAATMIRRHNQTVRDLQRQQAIAQARIDNLRITINVLKRIVEGE